MSSNNISGTYIEPWFIPIDIILIICTSLGTGLAIIFLLIIIFDKTCHTVPMMLVANSCLAELAFGSVMLSSAVFTFQNDLQKIQYQDSLCIIRGYLGYGVTFHKNFSYFLQATYRYITVIYPNRLSWQTARFQGILISLIWIVGILCTVPYLLTNSIEYRINDQICQMPLQLNFLTVYNALVVYMIPISLIMFIYFKLVRYIREMNKNITPIATVNRAQRQLKMIRRIVILVNGVATVGFPYALFVFWSFFATPPKYHFRIAYIFVDAAFAFVMITLFKFTEPLKASLIKLIKPTSNRVIPTVT
ncbi:unnamed protein product [Adineta steineri]|uniref:G-protein coupled receptors family 1 profile domain-containing protein n=1 Tax=Adineta steineri TaxID=433720 RepID=A0A819GXD7_9BILA|nr:unnamed protein product [Adineta steineri]CAF3886599.1 unnamed protein product [Adineta steineri]